MGWWIGLVVVLGGLTALVVRRRRNRPVDDARIDATQRRDAENRRRGPREYWGGV